MSTTTTIRVKTNTQKLLRKVAGAMEVKMQEAAEIAIRKLAQENAPWALKVDNERIER